MDFYYRTLKDGRCEVVCTRCFITVGAAGATEAIRSLENTHRCPKNSRTVGSARTVPASAYQPFPGQRRPAPTPIAVRRQVNRPRAALLVIAAAALLYALPTLMEFAALRSWNPWISVVLPGDLAGCACLILFFGRIRTAIALYWLLTSLEAGLYALHIVPSTIIPWITDLIPTLLVMRMVWRSAADAAVRAVYF